MKRVTALLILLALRLTFSGCGGSTQSADLLSALDNWVCDGAAPDGLTAYVVNRRRGAPA